MSVQHGVIDKVTGDLLRCGKCNGFATDGSFDAANEEVREDVPFPATVRDTKLNRESETMHQWDSDAEEWNEVAQPPVV